MYLFSKICFVFHPEIFFMMEYAEKEKSQFDFLKRVSRKIW